MSTSVTRTAFQTASALLAALTLAACAADTSTSPVLEPSVPSAVLFGSTCLPTRSQPDLVPTLTITGTPKLVSSTRASIPFTAVVKNIGSGCAGTFRISGHQFANDVNPYMEDGARVVGITVTETATVDKYGWTKGGLNNGASVSFSGTILVTIVYGTTPGVEAAGVRIKADACDYVDEEYLPTYCRVVESNETNNKTPWALVTINPITP
jgi:hypothetical protein